MDRERDSAETLNGVAQHQGALRFGERAELCDGLDDADLVVDQHRCDESGAMIDAVFGEGKVDEAVEADREDVGFEALGC